MTTTQDTSRSPHHNLAQPYTSLRRPVTTLDVGLVAGTAYRNLVAGGWKTVIVGSIICFGTAMVVVNASIFRSTVDAMQRNISGSLTGDLQVYSAQSKDAVDVLGGLDSSVNLATLTDYAAVRKILEDVPNVDVVVPMAMESGLVTSESSLDRALAALRVEVNVQHALPEPDEAEKARLDTQKGRVRELVSALSRDVQSADRIETTGPRSDAAELQRVSSDAFWGGFDADPYAHLEQLDNSVANAAAEGEYKPLRYVGTDPAAFKSGFERIEIVDGALIAPGERGFMLSKFVYEEHFKLRTARRLDKIKRAIETYGASIAKDPTLQSLVRENLGELRAITLQLDAAKTVKVRAALQAFLHSERADVSKLLTQFLSLDDDNFQTRYAFFYEALAPQLELYQLEIGDDITIQAIYRNGYVRAAKLKVAGTYRFKGLEDSPQAGGINMMDLVSFRELHGLGVAEHDAELKALQSAAAVVDVSRERADQDLFAVKQVDHEVAQAAPVDVPDLSGTRARHEQALRAGYDPRELKGGAVTSLAIKLHDSSKLEETGRAIEAASQRAGLPLKAAAWHQASGVLGQFANIMRTIVMIGGFIIFVVALVVINNALVMATLGRVKELGTLRALGAQRRLVLGLLLVESAVLGAIAGGTGTGLGALALTAAGKHGLPAGSDSMAFLFGGPRLFPTFGASELLVAFTAVLAVSLLSAVYPAWLAARVSPREAMQTED